MPAPPFHPIQQEPPRSSQMHQWHVRPRVLTLERREPQPERSGDSRRQMHADGHGLKKHLAEFPDQEFNQSGLISGFEWE